MNISDTMVPVDAEIAPMSIIPPAGSTNPRAETALRPSDFSGLIPKVKIKAAMTFIKKLSSTKFNNF